MNLKAEEKMLGAYNCLNSQSHSKNVVSREKGLFRLEMTAQMLNLPLEAEV